jgi:hypothetical protein
VRCEVPVSKERRDKASVAFPRRETARGDAMRDWPSMRHYCVGRR